MLRGRVRITLYCFCGSILYRCWSVMRRARSVLLLKRLICEWLRERPRSPSEEGKEDRQGLQHRGPGHRHTTRGGNRKSPTADVLKLWVMTHLVGSTLVSRGSWVGPNPKVSLCVGEGATEQDTPLAASYFADVAGEEHSGEVDFLLQGCHLLGKHIGHSRVFVHLEEQQRT